MFTQIHLPPDNDPLAWSGSFGKAPENVITLNEADFREIQAALRSWKANDKNGDASSVSRETFPLPHLGPRLERIARNLHFGSGFTVLRGLDTRSSNPEDNLLVYLGISSYIGPQRGESSRSPLLQIYC